MAENFEYNLRVELEDNVSQALNSMSRSVQNAFALITKNAQQSISPTRQLKKELADLNAVLSTTQQQNKSVGSSFANLTNNLFTLRKALNEARSAAKVLETALNQVDTARRNSLKQLRIEESKGSGADKARIKSISDEIKSLRQLEKEIRRVKSGYDALSSSGIRLHFATLNKDIGLLGKSFIDFGKNLNYVGRNLTFALTMPILGFINYGINNLRKLDKEVVRTRKILDDSFATTAERDTFMITLGNQLDELSFKSTKSYKALGIARELVQGIAADFAQLGVEPEQIFTLTRLTAELEKIGDVEIGVAKDFILSAYQQAIRVNSAAIIASGGIINAAKLSESAIAQITGSLYQLNVIENKTVLSLKNIADAFPEMQGVATTFGLTMLEAASMFAPMVAAGFEIGASANSIKVSLQRIVAPTKQNKDMMTQLNEEFGTNFEFNAGLGIETIQKLVDAYGTLKNSAYGTQGALEFFARLFGVRQGPRMDQAIRQLYDFQDQLQKVGSDTDIVFSTIAKNINQELSKIGVSKEFKTNNIQSISEITRYAADAQAKGNLRVVAAIEEGQKKSVETLDKQYSDFYKKVPGEAGKVYLTQLLGTKQAEEIYRKELDAANNTVEAKLGRAREVFKSLSTKLVPIFVDIVQAILPLLQKLTDWIANLPDSSKKLLGLGLAFLAALGPVTTLVATLSQIGGVLLRVFSSLSPIFFRFLRMPKAIGSSLADASRGFDLTNSRMSLFGKLVDRLTDRMPRFGNAVDFAFGGVRGARTDLIKLGDNIATLGSSKKLAIKSLLLSLFDLKGSRTDIDKIATDIVNLTTDSIGKRRVVPGKGIKEMLANIFSAAGINVFGDLEESIDNVAESELYLSTYSEKAAKMLATQSGVATKKGRQMSGLSKIVKTATLEEKRLEEQVDSTGNTIWTAKETGAEAEKEVEKATKSTKRRGKVSKPVVPVFTGSAYEKAFHDQLVASGFDFSMLGAKQKMTAKLRAEGGGTVDDLLNAAKKEIEDVKQATVEAATAPIDDLVAYKDSLLAEFGNLQRKGPKGLEQRFEKIIRKAKSLGIPATNAKLQQMLFNFVDEGMLLLEKPKEIAKATAQTLKKQLTAQDIRAAFDVYNKSNPDGASRTTRLLQNELAEIIGKNASDSTAMLQQSTYEKIISEIESGKLLNVSEIVQRTDRHGRLSKSSARYRSLFKESQISSKIKKSLLSKQNVVDAVLNVQGLDALQDISNLGIYDDQVIRYVLKDIPEMREGGIRSFEAAIQRLLIANKGDKKAQEKIKTIAQRIMMTVTGQAYQTKLLPQRKKLIGVGESGHDMARIAKLEGLIAREQIGIDRVVKEIDQAREKYRMVVGGDPQEEKHARLQLYNVKEKLKIVSNRREEYIQELELLKKGPEKFVPISMPIPDSIDDLMDIESGLSGVLPYDETDLRERRRLTSGARAKIKESRASRILGGERIGPLAKQMSVSPKATKQKIDKIKKSIKDRLQREANRLNIFKFGKVVESFKKDFPLMSLLPIAGLGSALMGMSNAPGGLLGKLFGGGAGAAAMAAVGGGGLDKDALKNVKPKTILDEVVKRRGLKGKEATALKKLIVDRFTAAGNQQWLDILLHPIDSIKNELKESITNMPEKGTIKTTNSASRIIKKLKGTGAQLRHGVEEAVNKTAKLIDDVSESGPEALDKIIDNINKTSQATSKRIGERTEPVRRGRSKTASVTEKTENRRAKKAAKEAAATAASEEVAEAATDAAQETSEQIVKDAVVEKKKKPSKAKSKVVAAEVTAETEVNSEVAQAAAAASIKDDVCELTDDVKQKIIIGLMSVHGMGGATIAAEAVAEVQSGVAQVAMAYKATLNDVIDDYTRAYMGGAFAHQAGSLIPAASPLSSKAKFDLKPGKIPFISGLEKSFTSLSKSAGYASIGLGKLSAPIFGLVPIFGRMLSQGLVNRGQAAVKTANAVRTSLSERFIEGRDFSAKKFGSIRKFTREIAVDFAAAGASIFQLVNPLKIMGGLIKGIMSGLKMGLLFSGIGTVMILVAGAVIAIKSAIQNFEPIVKKLKEAWTNISQAISIIVKPLFDMIAGFAGVEAKSKNAGNAVEDSANSAKSAVSIIVGFIVFMSKKFRENAEKIGKFVKEKIIPIFIQIINIVILIGKTIYDIFSGNFRKAGSASDELMRRILYGFLAIVKAVLPVLKEFVKIAVLLFAKLADFIVQALIRAIDAAFDYLKKKLLNPTSGSGGWSGLISKTFGPAGQIFGFIFGGGGGGGATKDFGESIGEEFAKGVKDGVIGIGKDISISDWLRSKITFDQDWIGGIVDSLFKGTDAVFGGLIAAVGSAMESVADDFEKKFGRAINKPIDLTPPGQKEKINEFINDMTSEISTALESSGQELGQDAGNGIRDGIKQALEDLQQRFVDLVTDNLGGAVDKYKTELTSLLEEQKDKQLQYFDDQIAAIDALEKAEEELTQAVEYETGRRRMIEERDLQRANYQRNRALAIYEGRVDDARTLDLEEQKNTTDFRDNLDKYDKDRARSLQQKQRETAKQILEQQKKDAEKAFDEIIKNFEKFIEDIGKYGTYNQEELTEQFNAIANEAAKASKGMIDSFEDFYLEIPKLINQYTDPTIGFFERPLDELIAVARTKFGLGADSGVSPDTILGNTAAMMLAIGQTFTDMGPDAGDSFKNSFEDVISNYVVPIIDKLMATVAKFDPATIFKKAIDDANYTLLREQQKLIDGLDSLVKGMIGLLDPAIAKWYALKAAIEAASSAASGGAPSPGGGGDGNDGSGDTKDVIETPPRGDFKTMLNTNAWAIITSTLPTALASKKYTIYDSLVKMWTDIYNKGTTYEALSAYLKKANTGETNYLNTALTSLRSKMPTEYGGTYKYYTGGLVKKYATGGFAIPGFRSSAVPAILHGGEYVINSKAVSNIGLAALQAMNNMRFASPGRMQSPQVTTINETRNVNIYVDNFIGQEQWFESMMKEYNVKVVPRNQKAAGLEFRTVSSYSGINRGI